MFFDGCDEIESIHNEKCFNGGVANALVSIDERMFLMSEKPIAEAFSMRVG